MASDDAFPKITTDQLEGDTEALFQGVSAWITPEVVAEVERVFAMLEAHGRGECEREFVPWLDDEIVPTDEWLAKRIDETGGKC